MDPILSVLRDHLLTYLLCTSPDRAHIIAEPLVRNPGMSELLAELEADDDLLARFEMELLKELDEERPHALSGVGGGLLQWICSR